MEISEDIIQIKGLQVYGHSGVSAEEKSLPQQLIVDADMMTAPAGMRNVRPFMSAVRTAAVHDDIAATVDYGAVCHMIKAYIEKHTHSLIETLVEGLAAHLLLNVPHLSGVRLTLQKPEAPIGLPVRTVAIQIERRWHIAYVALWSSTSEKKSILDEALAALGGMEGCTLGDTSSYAADAFHGKDAHDVPSFAAACLRTILDPFALASKLSALAAAVEKKEPGKGTGALEAAILLYDDEVISYEGIHIPHPDLPDSEYMLRPLSELAPYFLHPVLHKTMLQLFEETERR